jgi:long-chain fatty acid transport protein
MKKILRTLALSGLAAAAMAAQARAAGFYLQEQSVRGTGRAYSGEVADQGVASLWWNPAAITSSPREAYLGVSGIFVDAKVQNQGSTITYPGGITLPMRGDPFAYNPIRPGAVPNFAVSMPIGDRFALGLSAMAPFNLTSKYARTSWVRYDAIESDLLTADLQLTGAMKVTDWLDVGVGLDAVRTEAKLSNALPNLSPLLPDGIQVLSGGGWDFGWTVGAQSHLGPLSLGASYRAAVDHELSGHVFVGGLLGPLAAANFDIPAKARFNTPWIATLGARYAVNDRLTLDAQVQRFGWSEFDNITVTTAAGTTVIPENYRDTTSGGVGLDYEVNPHLTLRAGVQYDPTPTSSTLRGARVPDGDRMLYGVGATGHVNDSTQIDAAFAYINFDRSTVNQTTTFFPGTPAAVTTALHGDVRAEGYVLSLGVRSRF